MSATTRVAHAASVCDLDGCDLHETCSYCHAVVRVHTLLPDPDPRGWGTMVCRPCRDKSAAASPPNLLGLAR